MKRHIPSTQGFQFIGGSKVLDFINTVGNRLGKCCDYFSKPGEVSRWAQLAALGQLRILSSDLADIRRRREYLYTLFLPFAHASVHAPFWAMAELNRDIEKLWRKRSLRQKGGKVEWLFHGSGAERLAHTIVSDAINLLVTGDCTLIRQCQDSSCGWLYLDRSREKNRRWCSMRDCGNRAKARRYYALHHGRKIR